jgi:hypothetical protein
MNGATQARYPVLRLAMYYGLLTLAVWAIVTFLPGIPALLTRFHELPSVVDRNAIAGGAAMSPLLSEGQWALITLIAMVMATALVLPVAWVYMVTKRRSGYDQSVVQTVIMLPMTVAGTVILVRNSLALAFALAAIVSAVRFRNTLKDTKDAVYIFLALAVGVAAGVLAPTVALVMSIVFNLAVLTLWTFNVGNMYADRLGGDRATRLGPMLEASADEKKKKRFNGAVVVRAARRAPAQRAVEALLEEHTKRWKLAGDVPGDGDAGTLEYLVRLKDESRAAPLLAAIRARGGADVEHAEFRSLRGLEGALE